VIKTKRKVALLRSLIQYIAEENSVWRDFVTEEERKEIMRTLLSTIKLFSKRGGRRSSHSSRSEINRGFIEIVEMLKNTRVCFKETRERMTFWEFLGQEKDYSKRSSNQEILILRFEEDERHFELIQKCKALEAQLYDLVCQKTFFKSTMRWVFSDDFGTLDHLREELSNTYQCEFLNLKVSNNETLDCVLISGAPLNKRSTMMRKNVNFPEGAPFDLQDESEDRPTIILCCPNAGYYEYMCYEGQWIDIYLKHGFQVFLWNYRGYGRSTGRPTPENLRRDGEEIVDYLREKLGIRIIGCHGESMGGLVAVHLARWKNINFLCADRTFESLSKVGSHVAGKFLAMVYRMITLWSDQVSKDYLEANCYKILTFDPRDEVIPFLCSLKHGVTMKMILNDLGGDADPVRPRDNRNSVLFCLPNVVTWFKKMTYAFRIELHQNRCAKKLNDYNIGLSKDQMIALFRAFERIFELWDPYVIAQRNLNMKNKKTQISLSLPVLLPSMPMRMMQPKPNTGDLSDNASMADSPKKSIQNSLANISMERGSAQKIPTIQETPDQEIQANENEIEKSLPEPQPLLQHQLRSQSQPEKSSADLRRSFARKSYLGLYNEEAQLNNQFAKFLGQVFSTLRSLEFAGVRISTILNVQEEFKLEAFEYFLKCLEVWGSRSPIYTPQQDLLINPNYYKTKALNKIQNIMTRIHQTIKLENLTQSSVSKLELLIIEDLELINEILAILEKNVKERNCQLKNYHYSMDIELAPMNYSRQPLLASTRRNTENHNYSIGHLIPLSCGHNGILEVFEVEIYEQFLKNASLT